MVVAIVGSRKFPRLNEVEAYVDALPPGTVVVSGAAIGVDRCAENRALERGLRVLSYPAFWRKHGRDAAAIRNLRIVRACDRLVAFWDGKSAGTLMTLRFAQRERVPFEIRR